MIKKKKREETLELVEKKSKKLNKKGKENKTKKKHIMGPIEFTFNFISGFQKVLEWNSNFMQ